jgi:hypothetical protein
MQSRITPVESSIASSPTTAKSALPTLSVVHQAAAAVRQQRRRSTIVRSNSSESGDATQCLMMSSSALDDSSTSLSSSASSSTRSVGSHSSPPPPQQQSIKRGEEGPAKIDLRRSRRSPPPIAPSSTPKADALNLGLRQSTVEGVAPDFLRTESGDEVTTTTSANSHSSTSGPNDSSAATEETTEVPETKDRRAAAAAGVRWGTVEIHSHAITLGDNVCSCGPPVTIGWTAVDTIVVQVDAYESRKPAPRHKGEMLLPAWVREDLLREAGYPRSSVLEASQSVAETKQLRLKSSRDGRFRESIVAFLKGGKAGAARRQRRRKRTSNSYRAPSETAVSKGVVEDSKGSSVP